jgi:chaperonin cofactor prefoldin
MQTKTEPALICPKCGESLKLTESLAAPLVAATRAEYEHQLREQAANFETQKQTLAKQQEDNERRAGELEKAARAQDEAVAMAVQNGIAEQLISERKRILSS